MSVLAKLPWIVLGLGAAGALFFYSRSGLSRLRPPQGGLDAEGALLPCPKKPNCVSSQAAADDKLHLTRPFPYAGTRQETQAKLAAILDATPRIHWVTRDERYWHLTATSRLFRFVDDVEFVFDDGGGVVHVRSASRVGHSDLGVNRKRVGALRAAYDGAAGGPPRSHS
jgi:uncharacterized protein (DUF1499 family)